MGAGEFVFVGAYHFEPVERPGVFGLTRRTFELRPVANTTEAEVLQDVLRHVEGTAWRGRILDLLGR